jgi:hypothetical protein
MNLRTSFTTLISAAFLMSASFSIAIQPNQLIKKDTLASPPKVTEEKSAVNDDDIPPTPASDAPTRLHPPPALTRAATTPLT